MRTAFVCRTEQDFQKEVGVGIATTGENRMINSQN